MPLIRVLEGRQILRRSKRELAYVDARIGGRGFRHWGRGQHPSPEKTGRDDERGANQRKRTVGHNLLLLIGCPFRPLGLCSMTFLPAVRWRTPHVQEALHPDEPESAAKLSTKSKSGHASPLARRWSSVARFMLASPSPL